MSLEKYKNNIRSQFGEDGIIKEIFERVGASTKVCIEFGAWDGEHLSNTWNLWNNHGWKAILIEGDKIKYDTLLEKYKNNKSITCIHSYVTASGQNSLDQIILNHQLNETIDFLSIDIDGNDYHILKNLNAKPRIVCIEYNPTIPPDTHFIQPEGEYIGSSAKSILELAKSKGYQPFFMTDTNIFLIVNEEFQKLNVCFNLDESFPKKYLSYVFAGYDGKTFINQLPVYTNTSKKSLYRKMLELIRLDKKTICNHSRVNIYDK